MSDCLSGGEIAAFPDNSNAPRGKYILSTSNYNALAGDRAALANNSNAPAGKHILSPSNYNALVDDDAALPGDSVKATEVSA